MFFYSLQSSAVNKADNHTKAVSKPSPGSVDVKEEQVLSDTSNTLPSSGVDVQLVICNRDQD